MSLFISLGKVLGPKWEQYHSTVNRYMIILGIASALLTGIVFAYRKYKRNMVEALVQLLTQGVRRFNSFGKVRFLLLRYEQKRYIRVPVVLGVILICLAVGVSRVYFKEQYPSDVFAGYVFGGVWISMNVILLEILRKLRSIKRSSVYE